MIRTRVGYAGGTTENPTYHNIGNHAETVQIDFDPSIISYKELLSVFWDSHNPVYGGAYGQYRSIILYHSDNQRMLAENTKADLEKSLDTEISTSIQPVGTFTQAEFYHQKYYLQADPVLAKEIISWHSARQDVIDSTATARINGYIAGYGNKATLLEEIDTYGLSEEALIYLRDNSRASLGSSD